MIVHPVKTGYFRNVKKSWKKGGAHYQVKFFPLYKNPVFRGC